jgi:hypothetical protein
MHHRQRTQGQRRLRLCRKATWQSAQPTHFCEGTTSVPRCGICNVLGDANMLVQQGQHETPLRLASFCFLVVASLAFLHFNGNVRTAFRLGGLARHRVNHELVALDSSMLVGTRPRSRQTAESHHTAPEIVGSCGERIEGAPNQVRHRPFSRSTKQKCLHRLCFAAPLRLP